VTFVLIVKTSIALYSGDKRTGCCIMTMHCLTLHFSPGYFGSKTT
jgi:hypothetical protein